MDPFSKDGNGVDQKSQARDITDDLNKPDNAAKCHNAKKELNSDPIGSMYCMDLYGIFTYIYHQNQPNLGKYTILGIL